MSTGILSAKELKCDQVLWKLDHLFDGHDDPRISEILIDAEQKIASFADQYKSKLHKLTTDELKQAFQEKEAILNPLYKVSQFSHLLLSLDTQNKDSKALVSKVDETLSRLSNDLLFFGLELGEVSNDVFDKKHDLKCLDDYHYPVSFIRKKAEHRLTEKEEQLVNLKDLTGIKAARKLYSELSSGFEFDFELDGELKTLNGSQLRNLRMHSDPEVRRRAMKLFYSRYEENQTTFVHLYNTIVKDYNIERKLRGYGSSISVMNSGNDIEDRAVEVLHEVTSESNHLVSRYYKLKKNYVSYRI